MEDDGTPTRLIRCLSFHADYLCQNSGVCCSSGWEIAVERAVHVSLQSRLREPSVRLPRGPDGFRATADPPPACEVSFRHLPDGSCWFRDKQERRCAIHREFGEPSLPSACRQFPRVCVLEPAQVSVSLSHYCPTAAALLFLDSVTFGLVDNPASFPGDWPFEGLDARDACSPFLRPGVLLGFDGLRAFEDCAVSALSEGDAWSALSRVEAAIDRIRLWTPAAGPLVPEIRRCFAMAPPLPDEGPKRPDPRATLLAAVPSGGIHDPNLPCFQARKPAFSTRIDCALRRYLGARLIAGWVVFQGEGLRTTARYLRLCLDAVLLFEAARPGDEPELERWRESIRSADLWLLHYCDPELLALKLG